MGLALGARKWQHALDKLDGQPGFLELIIRDYCRIPYIQHSRFVLYFGTFVGLSTAVGATCWIAGRLPATNVVRALVAIAAFPACLLSGYAWAWVLQRTQGVLQRRARQGRMKV